MSSSTPSFEEDMRLIREKRNISREALHADTKIALENIELFEEGDLGQHPHFNEVYLRALVRTYADVLDISTERALQALEQARKGTYEGALGDVYLDRERSADQETSETDVDAAAEKTADDDGSDRGEKAVDERSGHALIGEEGTGEVAGLADEPAADEPAADEPAGGHEAASSAEAYGGTTRARSASSGHAGRGFTEWLATGGTGTIVLGGAALILIVLAIWAYTVLFSGSTSTSAEQTGRPAAVDTTAEAPVENIEESAPAVTIGDSLQFTIIAANDRLEPIRVRLDGESWNPYWVEQGDSISFTARDAFAIRDYISRVRLRIEDLEWPIEAGGRYDTVAVSRQLVQQRLDSLSSSSVRSR